MSARAGFQDAETVLPSLGEANFGGGSVTPPPHRTTMMPPEGTSAPITIVDTVSWSIPEYDAAKCRGIMAQVLALFPEGTEWSPFEKGTQGYQRQIQLVSGSLVCGWAQFGALHGKMWLYITGAGLRCRRDANLRDADLHAISGIDGAKLTRVDIALDVYDHSTFSVEDAMRAYEAEEHFYATTPTPERRACDIQKNRYSAMREAIKAWKHLKAPVMPCTRTFESRRGGDDDRVARTFYIGKLDGPKMVRVYDKGLQIIGKFTADQMEAYRKDGVITSSAVPSGADLEQWTRVELVLRDRGKQELDAGILLDTDGYFAGGYPMLAKLLEVADGVRPSYIPREEECDHARMIEAHRDSYGGHVYFMSEVLGWSAEDIVRRIIGTKSSARLMVDKERAIEA